MHFYFEHAVRGDPVSLVLALVHADIGWLAVSLLRVLIVAEHSARLSVFQAYDLT